MAALTIGVHMGNRERQQSLRDTHSGEYEQQVHVPLTGQAVAAWASVDKQINWQMPFLYAPMQRLVPFEVPHFTYGIVFSIPPPQLVLLDAHVVSWTIVEEGWITGATMRFGVSAPGAASPVPYGATANLSFQGYCTLAEGDEFQ